jgi:hypothetical protein
MTGCTFTLTLPSVPSNVVPLQFKTTALSSESAKELQPIPDAYPVIVPLGGQETMQLVGMVVGETYIGYMEAWRRGCTLTASSSGLSEIPAASTWFVDKNELSRKGGYSTTTTTSTADFKLTIIRMS